MLLHTQKHRRFVWPGIAVSLAALLGSGAFVHLQAERTWSRMQLEVQSLQQSWHSRATQREPLWGEAVDDDATAHYKQALQIVKTLPPAATDRLQKVRLLPDAQVAAASAAVLAEWQPALRALRTGAHATATRATAPPGASTISLLDSRWLTNAAALQARVQLLADHDVEAVQCTLDAATFGADLMLRGTLVDQMIGTALVAIIVSTNGAWSESALARLDPAALTLLADGLDRLDRALPETFDQTGELLQLANYLQEATRAPDHMPMPSAWRYGFSSRWMMAEAFTMVTRSAQDMANARDLGWPQRAALIDREGCSLLDSGNPIASIIWPNMLAAEHNLRQLVSQLRMLRMSVAMHRGIDAPPLQDPLGDGPLQVTPVDNGLRLASAEAQDRSWLERVVAR